jgi:hypothetical protein
MFLLLKLHPFAQWTSTVLKSQSNKNVIRFLLRSLICNVSALVMVLVLAESP